MEYFLCPALKSTFMTRDHRDLVPFIDKAANASKTGTGADTNYQAMGAFRLHDQPSHSTR